MLITTKTLEGEEEEIKELFRSGEIDKALERSRELSSFRVAEIVRDSETELISTFISSMDQRRAARVGSNLPEEIFSKVLEEMKEEKVVGIAKNLSTDKIIDLLPFISKDVEEIILSSLAESEMELVSKLESYPEDTVGAVMKTSYLAVKARERIGDLISFLKIGIEREDNTDYIYVVDEKRKLLGVISAKRIFYADKNKKIEEIMDKDIIAAKVNDDVEKAARTMKARRYTMLPVVDEKNRLLGVLTTETALNVISEELADDFVSIGGSSKEESFFTLPKDSIKMRLPWMAVNVFLNLGAVTVITGFEETIAQVAILAAFLPMITDMGGNVGIQALSVSIRSIALGEVQLSDIWRAVRKELAIGIVNGLALGLLFGGIAYLLRGNPYIGILAGIALAVNVLVAGVVGGAFPYIIKSLGKDPAMMTGPVLTTITDITGVSIYLGLSTIFLYTII